MDLLGVIRHCAHLGYELRIKDNMGHIYIDVRYMTSYKVNGYPVILQCEQTIPDNHHINQLEEVIMFCIGKVNKLKEESSDKRIDHGSNLDT